MSALTSVTREEAEEKWIAKWERVPQATLLVNLFREHCVSEGIVHTKENGPYDTLYAPVQEREEKFFMKLCCFHNNDDEPVRVDLSVYAGNLSRMESDGPDWNVSFSRLAWFVADKTETGMWAYGRGNQQMYAIRLHLTHDFTLPSRKDIWFFEFMLSAVSRAGELALDITEQPRFWSGDGK